MMRPKRQRKERDHGRVWWFGRFDRSDGNPAKSGEPVPAGTVGEAIPQRWMQGGQASAIAPDSLGGQSQRAL